MLGSPGGCGGRLGRGGAWPTARCGTTSLPGHTESRKIRPLLDNSLAWDVYVRLAGGAFVDTAFAIDAYAGRIVG